MKTPETDTRVVDYLYDDLSDAQRSAYAEFLDSDEDAASEARSYQTLLELYREETEELTPSVAATERLLREAERATRPWLSRVLGELLPKLVMRPAMGVAMASVLIIGVGVFFVLSKDVDRGVPQERAAESTVARTAEKDRSVAPAPGDGRPRPAVAESGESSNAPAADALDETRADKGVAGTGGVARPVSTTSTVARSGGGKLRLEGLKSGALAGRDNAERAKDGLRRGRAARPAKRKQARFFASDQRNAGPAPPPRARPASRREPAQAAEVVVRRPAPKPAANTDRKLANKAVQKKEQKKLTPPALHNRAKKNLAKGRVALACRLFSSLVSQHRSYTRRADALLGWARCELARGSYNRAEQIIQQLLREYPKWRKFASQMLAEIRRQRAQAQYRAQRSQQRRKTKARRRAAPRQRARPARQAPASTSY